MTASKQKAIDIHVYT